MLPRRADDDIPEFTLARRVDARLAIARVYHARRRGETRAFEEALPRQVAERQVRDTLRRSLLLERRWATPLTAAMLDRELERIARDTHLPERLAEVYAALDDDPATIRECLARPLLAERLTRSFFASDPEIHAPERKAIEALHAAVIDGALDPAQSHPSRREVDLALAHEPVPPGRVGEIVEYPTGFAFIVGLDDGQDARAVAFEVPKASWVTWWAAQADRFDASDVQAVASATPLPAPAVSTGAAGGNCPTADSWSPMTGNAPTPRGGATAVWTGTEMIVWGGGWWNNGPFAGGGRYDPLTDTWRGLAGAGAPEARFEHTVVWTGSEMVVWGGRNGAGSSLGTGGRYDPASDTWSPVAAGPSARYGHTAVWTGSQMVVWGGGAASIGSGARYDPSTDSWAPVTTTGAPSGRSGHSAVWTGSEMIVWGGSEGPSSPAATGGRYDPTIDAWLPVAIAGAPAARSGHTSVWNGSEMMVWGGAASGSSLGTGGRYDPATDAWQPITATGAPSGRVEHLALWTGSEMIVWGGGHHISDSSFVASAGGSYDPANDTWSETSGDGAPAQKMRSAGVWTGELLLVWGGDAGLTMFGRGGQTNAGGRYAPDAGSWTPTSLGTGPPAQAGHTAVWTGTEMIVWGGRLPAPFYVATAAGGRYDPAIDAWSSTAVSGAPSLTDHTAVWTGSEMIVWGGRQGSSPVNLGARYDPLSDTWAPTTTTGAPAPRSGHTATWTGDRMVVWGGSDLATGGRYDPATDSWSATSLSGHPGKRSDHTAVWSGEEVLVWGGGPAAGPGGGRYDPVTDLWQPMTTAGAPSYRSRHTAVWTGNEMVVWGGDDGSATSSGGRYDPIADAWSATSAVDAPAARTFHGAVWTGSEMLVWGGASGATSLSSGGRYEAGLDTWQPTTEAGAPAGRSEHATVWTGERMIVWSGYPLIGSALGSGGLYRPDPPPDLDEDGVCLSADCDDGDPTVWSAPGPTTGLVFDGSDTLSWSAPEEAGTTTPVYEVLRSTAAEDFDAPATCLALDEPTSTAASDAEVPSSGGVFHYLVRAISGCLVGEGSLGTASDGTPRSGRSCDP